MARLLAAFLVFWLALGAQAQPGRVRSVDVNLTNPSDDARVRYQAQYQVENQSEWHDLGLFHTGTNRVELPAENLTLRIERQGWWVYVFREQTIPPNKQQVDLVLSTRVNLVTPCLPVIALALGLAGWWRRRGAYLLIQQKQELEPLIRDDGGVPQRKIGQYTPIAVLGAGGMGVVYKAQAPDGLEVAIKVPSPHLVAQSEFRLRFLREIELGLKLRHPNLVQVMELPPDTEELYVVMEYVAGRELGQVPLLPWPEEIARSLDWAAQVLDALDYIHACQIVHRDLKPANLMCLKTGRIKVMDFGIAHKLHGTRLTGTDHILGTPAYMAPEQLSGQILDGRADLYALGVILYERLAGGLPFPTEVMELLRSKLMEPLPSLAGLRPEASKEVCAFVDRLVALEREQRFADATSARAELTRLRSAGWSGQE